MKPYRGLFVPPAKVCPPCREGVHDPKSHTEMGCLMPVDNAPRDFVYQCEETGKAGKAKVTLDAGRTWGSVFNK